ncbi:MAG: hypothetical protein KA403_01025 [Candidatus Omnitrophica bacterium]|nr:hypothetical protein [Candidatus Omnitrophota bacterium]
MELIWIAIIGFVCLMGLTIFIYNLPASRLKRKRVTPPPPVKDKDWEEISKRWEKNNSLLVNEIESLKKERKTFLEQIEDGKKLVQEQIEQLAREKAWREKEGQMVEKVKHADHDLKEELRKTQNILNEGHSVKLRLEIEIQENKITIAKFKEEVRSLIAKQLAWEKESEANKKELRELKFTNAELKKQKDDIQWVTKTDYDLVMRRCRQLEGEMSRMTRDRNSQQSSEQPAVQPPVQTSQQIPEPPLEQVPEQTSIKAPEQPSEPVPEQPSEKAPEQPSEPVPEQSSEKVPEQPSEPIPEQAPEKVPELSTESILEQSPEKISEQPTEQIPEQTPEKAPELSSGNIPQQASQQSSDSSSEQVSEKPPEQPSPKVPDLNPEQSPEKDPEKKPES